MLPMMLPHSLKGPAAAAVLSRTISLPLGLLLPNQCCGAYLPVVQLAVLVLAVAILVTRLAEIAGCSVLLRCCVLLLV
jgi:hypothetical protein